MKSTRLGSRKVNADRFPIDAISRVEIGGRLQILSHAQIFDLVGNRPSTSIAHHHHEASLTEFTSLQGITELIMFQHVFQISSGAAIQYLSG